MYKDMTASCIWWCYGTYKPFQTSSACLDVSFSLSHSPSFLHSCYLTHSHTQTSHSHLLTGDQGKQKLHISNKKLEWRMKTEKSKKKMAWVFFFYERIHFRSKLCILYEHCYVQFRTTGPCAHVAPSPQIETDYFVVFSHFASLCLFFTMFNHCVCGCLAFLFSSFVTLVLS